MGNVIGSIIKSLVLCKCDTVNCFNETNNGDDDNEDDKKISNMENMMKIIVNKQINNEGITERVIRIEKEIEIINEKFKIQEKEINKEIEELKSKIIDIKLLNNEGKDVIRLEKQIEKNNDKLEIMYHLSEKVNNMKEDLDEFKKDLRRIYRGKKEK